MIVVLNTKSPQLIAEHANKETIRNKEARQECRFLLVETHERSTSIAILTVHSETGLLNTFQRSMQANRNIYGRKKHPFTSYPTKAPKTQQICHYRIATKIRELLLLHDTSVCFNSRNISFQLRFFAKVSVSLQFIIPWSSS